MGEWRTDRHGRWIYDAAAPDPDPTPTSIMSRFTGGPVMPEQTPRSVYDPAIGADGGGRYSDPAPVPTYGFPGDDEPDHPAVSDGPEHWTGSDPELPLSGPVGREVSLGEYDQMVARQRTEWAAMRGPVELEVCPRCGSGVHRDRLNLNSDD